MIFSDAAKFFAKFVLLCLFMSAAPVHALDLTGDGMSDVWQRVHNIANGDGNSDPDGDGQNNLSEAEAGTIPFAKSSFVKKLYLNTTFQSRIGRLRHQTNPEKAPSPS